MSWVDSMGCALTWLQNFVELVENTWKCKVGKFHLDGETALKKLKHVDIHHRAETCSLTQADIDLLNTKTVAALQSAGMRVPDRAIRPINTDRHDYNRSGTEHWLRQEVQAKRLLIEWIPTANMPAGGFTKILVTLAVNSSEPVSFSIKLSIIITYSIIIYSLSSIHLSFILNAHRFRTLNQSIIY
jgi:hypothetical protein